MIRFLFLILVAITITSCGRSDEATFETEIEAQNITRTIPDLIIGKWQAKGFYTEAAKAGEFHPLPYSQTLGFSSDGTVIVAMVMGDVETSESSPYLLEGDHLEVNNFSGDITLINETEFLFKVELSENNVAWYHHERID